MIIVFLHDLGVSVNFIYALTCQNGAHFQNCLNNMSSAHRLLLFRGFQAEGGACLVAPYVYLSLFLF